MRTRAARFSIVVSFLLCATGVRAEAGPPLLTDDPETPERNHWEINLAFTYDQEEDSTEIETPLLDINYGLMDHLQLKFEMPWESTVSSTDGHDPDGLFGCLVGLKGRFLDEDRNGVSMSFYPQFKFGWSSKFAHDDESESAHLVLPFELEKKLGPITAGIEYGMNFQKSRRPKQFLGFAIGHEFFERFELLAEIHGRSEPFFAGQEWVTNGGFRFKVNNLISLLGSAGTTFKSANHGDSQVFSYFAVQFHF